MMRSILSSPRRWKRPVVGAAFLASALLVMAAHSLPPVKDVGADVMAPMPLAPARRHLAAGHPPARGLAAGRRLRGGDVAGAGPHRHRRGERRPHPEAATGGAEAGRAADPGDSVDPRPRGPQQRCANFADGDRGQGLPRARRCGGGAGGQADRGPVQHLDHHHAPRSPADPGGRGAERRAGHHRRRCPLSRPGHPGPHPGQRLLPGRARRASASCSPGTSSGT